MLNEGEDPLRHDHVCGGVAVLSRNGHEARVPLLIVMIVNAARAMGDGRLLCIARHIVDQARDLDVEVGELLGADLDEAVDAVFVPERFLWFASDLDDELVAAGGGQDDAAAARADHLPCFWGVGV